MSEDKSLHLPDGTKLKWHEKSYKNYLNKTTVVYGRTGSGKSTIIDEIMYLCRDYVPTIFVVAPTNSSNNNYTNKVPANCIRNKLDAKWLEQLLQRQKNASELYQNANDMDNLKSVFDKVGDSSAFVMEASIARKADEFIRGLETSDMIFAKKKKQKTQILNNRNEMLKKLYKTTIRANKVNLESGASLSKKQKALLTFLDFNPNVMIICDDCASTFKKMYKQTTAIKEIFYEGRHYHFTTIISAQDDKEIDSELRKNTSISIFTTAQSVTACFSKVSNGFPKHERIRSNICIETVFKQDENDVKHYQKLAYIQNTADPFRYMIADIYDDFRMGSHHLWKYTDKIKGDRNNLNKKNPLYDKYV